VWVGEWWSGCAGDGGGGACRSATRLVGRGWCGLGDPPAVHGGGGVEVPHLGGVEGAHRGGHLGDEAVELVDHGDDLVDHGDGLVAVDTDLEPVDRGPEPLDAGVHNTEGHAIERTQRV